MGPVLYSLHGRGFPPYPPSSRGFGPRRGECLSLLLIRRISR